MAIEITVIKPEQQQPLTLDQLEEGVFFEANTTLGKRRCLLCDILTENKKRHLKVYDFTKGGITYFGPKVEVIQLDCTAIVLERQWRK